MDSLPFSSKLHALHEGGLPGLHALVTDRVLHTGQEQLVLEKGHVVNSFGLSLDNSGNGKTDGSHGGRLVINEAIIGYLDPAAVVIYQFVQVLFKVGKVSADCRGGIYWLKCFQKFLLDIVPDGKVNVVVLQQYVPDNGTIPEAHFELLNLTGFIPGGYGSGILDSVESFHAVMVVASSG